MSKMPTTVHNIIRKSNISIVLNRVRNISYIINENQENQTSISVQLPVYGRPKISEKITDDSNEFVNGFKVVQTENGEYAYVRETDNVLLPFRYDVASNFNEYGFAIVGKDGSVSWIDTSFKYLNLAGDFVEEDLGEFSTFRAWQGISEFSKGNIPLSRVYDGSDSRGKTAYLGTDGKLKKFYKYNGEINDYWPNTILIMEQNLMKTDMQRLMEICYLQEVIILLMLI